MGTRAAFWIGDPRDIESREWLGCKAFDGHPEGFADLSNVVTEKAYRNVIAEIAAADDWASPVGGWPYPWADDVFVTDFTYAFFGSRVMVSCFKCGFVPLPDALKENHKWPDADDPSLENVSSGHAYDRTQPDSIMVISIPSASTGDKGLFTGDPKS